MAGKGDGSLYRKRKGDQDEISGDRKRKNLTLLQLFDQHVDVEDENGSPDNDFEVEEEESVSSDDDVSNNYKILIKTVTGKIISLKVNCSYTIGFVKLKIYYKEHIPIEQQELFFNGNVVDNIGTLANLAIKKKSVLTLLCKSQGLMNIFIKTPKGSDIESLEVKPSDTIRDVKAKMRHGFRYRGHVLIFNEVVLEDCGTLVSFGITNGSTLTLVEKSQESMEIFVNNFKGETISLLVHPRDTIASVKDQIEYKEGIPSDEQALIFNEEVLLDKATLLDFRIYMQEINPHTYA